MNIKKEGGCNRANREQLADAIKLDREYIHEQILIVFAPKYRRKVAYGELKQDIANILSMLCKRKGVEIVEAEICPDHVHMLVKISPNISISSFMGYLKGKSTLMIFERHANLKYKYGNRHFLV